MVPTDKPRNILGIGLLIAGLFLIGWQLAVPASASSLLQSAEEGAQLFQQYCQACHTIGKGDLIGPDLQGVTQRQDAAWLVQFITQPDVVLASGDATANALLQKYGVPMPNLGLTDAQAQSLVAYLEAPDAVAAAPAAPALPAGQAAAGHALFTGQTGLTNGGTPCIACHSTLGVGAAGGGCLRTGPDQREYPPGRRGADQRFANPAFPHHAGHFHHPPTDPPGTSRSAGLFAADRPADCGQLCLEYQPVLGHRYRRSTDLVCTYAAFLASPTPKHFCSSA